MVASEGDAWAPPRAGCDADRADLAALERALLAARQLRDALDAAACRQAGAVTELERALALAAARPACDHLPAFRGARATPGEVWPAEAAIPRAAAGLSRREWEVLGLLAAGRSSRQIAAALCLSPRTVQRHVANAYRKIGAHNRAEATAYVLLGRAA